MIGDEKAININLTIVFPLSGLDRSFIVFLSPMQLLFM